MCYVRQTNPDEFSLKFLAYVIIDDAAAALPRLPLLLIGKNCSFRGSVVAKSSIANGHVKS